MFCHQCGAAIADPDDRFCSRCGARLRRPEAARDAPASAPPASAPAPETGLRRPVSAWPNRPRERIQLPLTELRQRRARETGEAAPLTGVPPPLSRGPVPEPPAPPASGPAPVPEPGAGVPPGPTGGPEEESPIEVVDVVPVRPEPTTSRSRAEEALRRMVPPKEVWRQESQPGPVERGRVRDEWPAAAPGPEGEERGTRAPTSGPSGPPVEDPIIPWLDPPVLPVPPERPAPPSREAVPDEGPVIVPRDYEEKKAERARKGRRRPPGRAKGPLFEPAALSRAIRPSWILAIGGVILLTLIVFAIFPPGGPGGGNETGNDRINRFTGMPIHTVATPTRPAGTGENGTIASITTQAVVRATVPTVRAWTTPAQRSTTTSATPTDATEVPTPTAGGVPGIRVVISSEGSWAGTIGQQAETYTETPVAGQGTQSRAVTGPARMVTVNIQKLGGTPDLLEVRVERDGIVLKQGSTRDPNGIVALSVEL
ncbi:MAG TPA: zinc-ribbon domain-containing protein [Methanoregulaceae archaeon]|nr:zinc-ribbon domain-containing protein [Methanoregulaceae archaeon]